MHTPTQTNSGMTALLVVTALALALWAQTCIEWGDTSGNSSLSTLNSSLP